jgi:hypothetical protein
MNPCRTVLTVRDIASQYYYAKPITKAVDDALLQLFPKVPQKTRRSLRHLLRRWRRATIYFLLWPDGRSIYQFLASADMGAAPRFHRRRSTWRSGSMSGKDPLAAHSHGEETKRSHRTACPRSRDRLNGEPR